MTVVSKDVVPQFSLVAPETTNGTGGIFLPHSCSTPKRPFTMSKHIPRPLLSLQEEMQKCKTRLSG